MKTLILMGVVKGIVFLCLLVVFLVIGLAISSWVKKRNIDKHSGDELLGYTPKIVHEVIVVGILAFGAVIAFYTLGFNTERLVFGLSFGIAYASKTTISNVLSGIMILNTKEFKLGDVIELMYDSGKEYFGRIEEVTLRYTVIRRKNRKKIIIPNHLLTSHCIATFSSEPTVRLETTLYLSRTNDVNRCKTLIEEAVQSLDFVVEKEFTLVLWRDIGDRGVEFLIYFYIDPNGGRLRRKAISDVNKQIIKVLQANKIHFAYRHKTLNIDPLSVYNKQIIRRMSEKMHT